MEKKTKIMIGVGIALAAIAGFLWWKNSQEPELSEDGSGVALPPAEELPPVISDGEPTKNGVIAQPAKNKKIQLFQDWMDKNHPNWTRPK